MGKKDLQLEIYLDSGDMKIKKFRVRCSTITKYVGMCLESVNDAKIRFFVHHFL